jgi:hypothetical protein
MTSVIRREVEGLEQKLKEDIQTLKHEYVEFGLGSVRVSLALAGEWLGVQGVG